VNVRAQFCRQAIAASPVSVFDLTPEALDDEIEGVAPCDCAAPDLVWVWVDTLPEGAPVFDGVPLAVLDKDFVTPGLFVAPALDADTVKVPVRVLDTPNKVEED